VRGKSALVLGDSRRVTVASWTGLSQLPPLLYIRQEILSISRFHNVTLVTYSKTAGQSYIPDLTLVEIFWYGTQYIPLLNSTTPGRRAVLEEQTPTPCPVDNWSDLWIRLWITFGLANPSALFNNPLSPDSVTSQDSSSPLQLAKPSPFSGFSQVTTAPHPVT
jgi:hypothetical protein